MSRVRDQLRHAFSVDDPDAIEPTEQQRALIDKVAYEIARRGMSTPAQIVLHSAQPYNYLFSQTMHFFSPTAGALLWVFAPFLPKHKSREDANRAYRMLAEFLEHRGSLPYIEQRVQHFEEYFQRLQTSAGAESSPGSPADGSQHTPHHDHDDADSRA